MRRRRRKKRGLRVLAAAIVTVGIIGFFVLPPIIKAQLEKQITAALDRKTTVGRVRVNPFALSLTLEDLDIREKGADRSFLGWGRLYVRIDALRSLTGEWALGAIELEGFHAGVAVNPDGSFNFSDLLRKYASPGAPASKPSTPIWIGSLTVNGAQVQFDDHSLKHPFSTHIGPLTFSLTGFKTAGASGAPYHFDARTEAGETFSWSGTLVAEPFSSTGEFRVGSLVLDKYAPYLESLTRAGITGGTLSVNGRYAANFDPAQRTLRLDGTDVALRGLRVVDRADGAKVMELGALDVSGVDVDAVAMKASATRVSAASGHLAMERANDGSINLAALIPHAGAPKAHPAPNPEVRVGEVAVTDFNVDVTDYTTPHPAHLALQGLQASLRNFSLAPGAVMPVQLSLGWAPKGAVKVDGTVVLRPDIKADLTANVSRLAVLPLSPYVEHFVDARLTQGSVSSIITIHASVAGDKPAISAVGDASFEGFGLVDGRHDRDLAGFSWLAVAGLALRTAPELSLSVRQIDIDGPYVRARVNADKSVNLATIMLARGPVAPGPVTPLPRIEIGRVVIDGGDFSFTDQSLSPAVQYSITGFGGSISGLSSQNLERADVDLKGMVGGSGPLAVSGKLDPLGAKKFVSLKIDLRNADLVPLSPYSGKFAGYELARGQLLVDSNILLDGDRLDATNVVTLNQFSFGAATPGPDATGLPVRLGVALLKDVDGRIVIDLPVQGTLGDPSFRIGKVILRVIVNILTKAAVSPFALVGSMFGGGPELGFQEFAPGSSELEPAETPKLDTLAKALTNRPGLSLGIEGSADPAADTYALKRAKLADRVRRRIWEGRHAVDPNIAPPDRLVISADENAAMVKKLFDATFPPGTQFGTPLPPPPEAAPPPAGPQPGIIRRIVDLVTFKAGRDQKAARDESDRMQAAHNAEVATAVAAGLPPEEMTGRLAETITISRDDLAALASSRARAVRDYLAATGHIAVERLFLSKGAGAAAPPSAGPRVLLTLE